ncbi:hypothetical protein [Pseudodesulfovibrio senegalensis]|jgi:MoxR-like ATPase|uniref:Uncharacterized protein n=1 Tax=Pseudodesulfovibrio senegalensis TaxID=1721087 RepID=A0A6N6MZU7_9BACT|nr:hypothetical protein [Pseudodesulfovibrio senegalensis]KAB1440327.1 hypothetical protein F8A88_13840 [Pseudodesulfovibrio senegalensis]
MGRIIQIRVSASTPDEKDVEREWPVLDKLVWTRGEFMNPVRGAAELAQAAYTAVVAGLIDKKQAEALGEKAREGESLRRRMESALAARNAAEADSLSYQLEDALDEMETIAKGF